ncbi:MAG: GcrA family cell cycle regulator [Candidatus Micropelagos sp.]|jgi:GcrA cell cycle regulator|uniref:GcrA cell cycle regulator n=1 Tax=PS1 clade bacterium TaxID=2175152 RepID=A0A368EJQ2_9PROT|nr:GcrA cell cycle regulator [Hyphomicrobiales bacterium]MBL6767183.1 GcrA cell cycle regulator [Candidatus Micropelagos sp.]NCG10535.1 GcrA cell cycle regulator [Alphaproteobacteria bacterium]OUV48765.1 MAG: GcrA cell cycle regulator [Alphaproteobacteria bacterium TMED110]RCL84779.1 MAG: GcrA cell cycle regulator [PS1 clade bacterium]HCN31536.1 GcrA cell cycle regulator [Rhodobiaceae bacterium]|tara:strand:+ start:103 stop:594 length:492 start_codon:yes stop_codon:yes gene_type:complete
MAWTEERVELLKKLWTEGLSASQIARQMGGVTRNAVIGKVHRLGLSGRATPARVSTAKVGTQTARTRQTQPSIAGTKLSYDKDESLDEMKYDPAPEPILSPEERASVLNLTEHTCKWPIGDPGNSNFHFCGARSKPGNPYCETHVVQAYQPVERRRRKSSGQA